jgi:hypothetical protein
MAVAGGWWAVIEPMAQVAAAIGAMDRPARIAQVIVGGQAN